MLRLALLDVEEPKPAFDVASPCVVALPFALVATEPTVPLACPVSVPAITPVLLLVSPWAMLLENCEL